MKHLLIILVLVTSSCASHSYPVTGAAKKAEKNQQNNLRHQFPRQ